MLMARMIVPGAAAPGELPGELRAGSAECRALVKSRSADLRMLRQDKGWD